MNYLLKIFISFIFLCLPALVFAQQKIAIVDLERALSDSAYAKAQLEQLANDQAFKANLEIHNKLGDDLKKMQEDAKVNSVIWSDQQKQDSSKKFEEKVKEINAVRQQLERQRAITMRGIQNNMAPFLREALNAIIEEQQLDLLLKAGSVRFYKSSLDLTDQLIARLDKLQAAE